MLCIAYHCFVTTCYIDRSSACDCNQFGHSVLAFVRTAPGSLSLSGSFRKALPSFLTRSHHSMARDCGPHKIDPGPWKCMMKTLWKHYENQTSGIYHEAFHKTFQSSRTTRDSKPPHGASRTGLSSHGLLDRDHHKPHTWPQLFPQCHVTRQTISDIKLY